jgi:uncharacterized protein (DUF2235 family)
MACGLRQVATRPSDRNMGQVLGRESYNKSKNIHVVDGEDLTVEFVGVWDTVAAYGLPIDELTRAVDYIWPLSMPDQDLHQRVKRAMHALSLDDERNTFHPQLWNEGRPPKSSDLPAPNEGRTPVTINDERLSQVWFAGVHSDVGGGPPKAFPTDRFEALAPGTPLTLSRPPS